LGTKTRRWRNRGLPTVWLEIALNGSVVTR
jgi:hypothetical protein